MKRNGKRGFTIVELVVVIAVVAILAAVLIPTFASVIKKANVSNDVVLVKELNDGLKLEEVGGKKNETMTDALNVARKYGFEVEKLTPRSSGEILWDSVNNRFVLLDENGGVVYQDESKTLSTGANLWKIVNNADDAANNTKYSSYIKGNATIATLTVTNGVDVGENTVTELTYENTTGTAKTVDIRTNGGNLIVNAPLDEVNHHNTLTSATLKAVAPNSYHEYGTVAEIELTEGRVVVESGSVDTIRVVATDETKVSVKVKENAEVKAIAATNETVASKLNEIVEVPTGSNTSVATEKVGYLPPFVVSGLGTAESPYIWMGAGVNGEYMTGYLPDGTIRNNTKLADWIIRYAKETNLHITLGCDVEGTKDFGNFLFQVTAPGKLTFDLAGHTLKVVGKKAVFYAQASTDNAEAEIVINDSVGGSKVEFSALGTGEYGVSAIRAYASLKKGTSTAKIVVNGGSFEVTATENNYASPAVMAYAPSTTGVVEVIINDGYFKSCVSKDCSGNSTVLLAAKSESSKITINGGYFETAGEFAGKLYVLNMQDGWNGAIYVNGGTFKNYLPDNIYNAKGEVAEVKTDTGANDVILVGDDYKVVNNGDSTYSVVKK